LRGPGPATGGGRGAGVAPVNHKTREVDMTHQMTLELPVSDNYNPNAWELNRFVYLISKHTIGCTPRAIDHKMCLMLAGGINHIRGNEGLSKLCQATCDYLRDHICGLDETHTQRFFDHVKPLLQEWYNNSTKEERSVYSDECSHG